MFGGPEIWNQKRFTLLSGQVAYKGGFACLVRTGASAGKVVVGKTKLAATADLLCIGVFAEDKTASGADALVNVSLFREITGRWWDNSSLSAVAATDVGKFCYLEDDQTVTMDPTSTAVVGRVWAISSTDGVLVEPLGFTSDDIRPIVDALPAFAANDCVIPSYPTSGAVYPIPATAAASTVTLPALAFEGTELKFFADGTANGHTVTYRDATGPVNLTAALTASKRHLAIALYLSGKWAVTVTAAP